MPGFGDKTYMTWRDAWYGLAVAALSALGHWLISGVWLGVNRPVAWMASAAVLGIGTVLWRPAWREHRRRIADEVTRGTAPNGD